MATSFGSGFHTATGRPVDYAGMAVYKIGILLFTLVPSAALYVVACWRH